MVRNRNTLKKVDGGEQLLLQCDVCVYDNLCKKVLLQCSFPYMFSTN